MENVEALQKQIEYYMSDKNLENDEFFHTKISEAKEVQPSATQGFIDVDLLLNCNKIKKLGVKTTAELLKAIEKSDQLEVHTSKKLFRRKPEHKLPELKTKKVKPNNPGEKVAEEKNPNDNPYKSLETYHMSYTESSSRSPPTRKYRSTSSSLWRHCYAHSTCTRRTLASTRPKETSQSIRRSIRRSWLLAWRRRV